VPPAAPPPSPSCEKRQFERVQRPFWKSRHTPPPPKPPPPATEAAASTKAAATSSKAAAAAAAKATGIPTAR
jgi:hypothetical protein